MKIKIHNSPFFTFLFICGLLIIVFELTGCEAFVRKFTRKPKKEDLPKEEMVIEPQEYKEIQASGDSLYKQYFLFWRSWQDELIQSLSAGANHKKQTSCAEEILKNLEQLYALLSEDKQKDLGVYIKQTKDLIDLINKDIYGTNVSGNRFSAERIKRNITRDFSYNKVSKPR